MQLDLQQLIICVELAPTLGNYKKETSIDRHVQIK